MLDLLEGRIEVGDCWLWTGGQSSNGYGKVWHEGKAQYVHRVVWKGLIGHIGDGLEIDHLCRVPLCCNPDHLEPVPHTVNARRGAAAFLPGRRQAAKAHCPQGHKYSEANTYVDPRGWRQCMTCRDGVFG